MRCLNAYANTTKKITKVLILYRHSVLLNKLNFLDIAIRMGTLILLINEVEYVNRNFEEYVVVLNLNGYDSVLEKIKQKRNSN